jgi:hypothetical protein
MGGVSLPYWPPDPPIPHVSEHILWRLNKGERTAICRVRAHPAGHELRMDVDGAVLWSQVFTAGDGQNLGTVADEHKARFVEKGWSLSP